MTSHQTEILPSLTAGVNRRDLLKVGLAGMLGVIPLLTLGANEAQASGLAMPRGGTYNISFRNVHTGESFSGAYRVGNKYIPEAFDNINVVLRDFRSGDVFPIDPRTMDILYMLQQKAGARGAYDVLSGYRCPKTNAMLHRTSTGVANNSLHMTGQAVDLRLPGYSLKRLRDTAINLRAGGVGYYPRSNFVHVDTGRIRHW